MVDRYNKGWIASDKRFDSETWFVLATDYDAARREMCPGDLCAGLSFDELKACFQSDAGVNV